jgi:hypothetical protein
VLKAARVREVEDSQESLVKTSAMMGDLPTGDPLETPTVQEIQDFYRNLCYDIKDLLNYCNRSEPGELIANLQKIALPIWPYMSSGQTCTSGELYRHVYDVLFTFPNNKESLLILISA